MKNNKRTIVLLVILLAVSALGYPIIRGNKSSGGEDSPAVHVEPGSDSASGYQSVSQLLNSVQSISLDAKIINNPDFRDLIDFTRPLINIPIGKANPFAN
jgi:hypothetical protein